MFVANVKNGWRYLYEIMIRNRWVAVQLRFFSNLSLTLYYIGGIYFFQTTICGILTRLEKAWLLFQGSILCTHKDIHLATADNVRGEKYGSGNADQC